MSVHAGRAWRFGDNIDTDALAPGLYMKHPIAELARHCLETVNPSFATCVKAGDIIVAGRNFGMGSSREQAVMALRELGVACVLARSFAGIFYRNAVNLGLLVMNCADTDRIDDGDRIEVDGVRGEVADLVSGMRLHCDPLPPHLLEMIADGGLVPHLERRLARDRGQA